MRKNELLNCWKQYRGSFNGYLLTSKEAFELAKNRMLNPHVRAICPTVFDCIINEVHEEIFCKYHDC